MSAVYNVENIRYQHVTLAPEEKNKYGRSARQVIYKDITDDDFKRLLVSMPPEEVITNKYLSFKIYKDADSFCISFFDYDKFSRYKKGSNHQLVKKYTIIRYIIKTNANNFYKSTAVFNNRRKRFYIRQNHVRYDGIMALAVDISRLLFMNFQPNSLDSPYELVSPELENEIRKITNILVQELNIPMSIHHSLNFDYVSSVETNFAKLLLRGILGWFCEKNQIVMDKPWLYHLMSVRHFTKPELKKHENNYLKTFLAHYHLTPEVLPHIQENFYSYADNTYNFVTLSVLSALFPKREGNFDYESKVAGYVDVFMDDNAIIVNRDILKVSIFLQNVFPLQNSANQKEFGDFVDYLQANRGWFQDDIFLEHMDNVGGLIEILAVLFPMGIHFNFEYVKEVVTDKDEFELFHTAVYNLLAQDNSFRVQDFDPKYKQKIERTFIKYGVKWKLQLYNKNTFRFSTRYSTVKGLTALLKNVKTGEILELNIGSPDRKRYVDLVVNSSMAESYAANHYPEFHAEITKMNAFESYTHHNVNVIPKQKLGTWDDMKHTFNQVRKVFEDNTRYFKTTNQLLYPILQNLIDYDEVLHNKLIINKP